MRHLKTLFWGLWEAKELSANGSFPQSSQKVKRMNEFINQSSLTSAGMMSTCVLDPLIS